MTEPLTDGGCDRGYELSCCLWGKEPEPLVVELSARASMRGLRVLDAGCGEGRNAVHLARGGASVDATDVSELALRNARQAWPGEPRVTWLLGDVRSHPAEPGSYDVVLFDSVAHWLADSTAVAEATAALQRATRPGGWHVVCAFNDRAQELDNHVNPPRCILPHDVLTAFYDTDGWELVEVHDIDIVSSHADQPIPHRHSVTKILARRRPGVT